MAVGWLRSVGAVFLLLGAQMINGCTSMKIDDFADKQPTMRPEQYFLGQTRGWGMFQDRFGKLRRQFVVDMVGKMEDGIFVLTEDFTYDDGEKEQRVWHVRPTGDSGYRGTANDVVGTAVGNAAGSAFNWVYDLNLKVGDSVWRVAFDDWMYLQPDGVILNRATATRWGFEIGTLTATFHKPTVTSSSLQAGSSAQAAQ